MFQTLVQPWLIRFICFLFHLYAENTRRLLFSITKYLSEQLFSLIVFVSIILNIWIIVEKPGFL
jgi:hypothetical protein